MAEYLLLGVDLCNFFNTSLDLLQQNGILDDFTLTYQIKKSLAIDPQRHEHLAANITSVSEGLNALAGKCVFTIQTCHFRLQDAQPVCDVSAMQKCCVPPCDKYLIASEVIQSCDIPSTVASAVQPFITQPIIPHTVRRFDTQSTDTTETFDSPAIIQSSVEIFDTRPSISSAVTVETFNTLSIVTTRPTNNIQQYEPRPIVRNTISETTENTHETGNKKREDSPSEWEELSNLGSVRSSEPEPHQPLRNFSKPEDYNFLALKNVSESGDTSCAQGENCCAVQGENCITNPPLVNCVDNSTTANLLGEVFSCSSCDRSFNHKKSLRAHEYREHALHQNSTFPCPLAPVCKKVFASKRVLDVHSVSHLADKPFPCTVCGKTFAQKVTRDHHFSQHTGVFKHACPECPKTFVSRAKLNFHMHAHREPRFVCEFCGKEFVRRDVLRTHLANLHAAPPGRTAPRAQHQWPHSAASDAPPPSHDCAECGASYKRRANLRLHARLHTVGELPCGQPGCGHMAESHQLSVEHAKACHAQVFLCVECGRQFKHKHSLREHERGHRAASAEEARPHACALCTRRYAQKGRLNVHMKTHKEEPHLACRVCGKRFFRRDLLQNHTFLHRGQRPFKCDHCAKSFAFKSNLGAHIATHAAHSASADQKMYQCEVCTRKFKLKSSYTTHLRAHRGEFKFECGLCHKKFMRKCHYDGHMRTHDKSRPHVCPSCGKGFKERKHCREHVKRMHPNNFSLETLFASITTEDEQVAEMLVDQLLTSHMADMTQTQQYDFL